MTCLKSIPNVTRIHCYTRAAMLWYHNIIHLDLGSCTEPTLYFHFLKKKCHSSLLIYHHFHLAKNKKKTFKQRYLSYSVVGSKESRHLETFAICSCLQENRYCLYLQDISSAWSSFLLHRNIEYYFDRFEKNNTSRKLSRLCSPLWYENWEGREHSSKDYKKHSWKDLLTIKALANGSPSILKHCFMLAALSGCATGEGR